MATYTHEMIAPDPPLVAWLFHHHDQGPVYIPPHWHQAVELSYTISGRIDHFFIDGTAYCTAPHDILIVNSLIVHSVRQNSHTHSNDRGLTITYPYALLECYFPKISQYQFQLNERDRFSSAQVEAYHQLQQLLTQIVAVDDSAQPLKNLQLNQLLLASLEILLTHFLVPYQGAIAMSDKKHGLEQLQQIKNYMDTHYQLPITLADIAQEVYLSKAYLSRFFKEYMGMTVWQYLSAIRARQAKDAIQQQRGTFTEIALLCGFSGLRTMNRALVANYGLSARAIKNAMNNDTIAGNKK